MFIHYILILVKCDRCGKYYNSRVDLSHSFTSVNEAIRVVTNDG